MKYKLVTGKSADNLSDQINKMLADGWHLYGHPFSDSTEEATILCQAVFKEAQ